MNKLYKTIYDAIAISNGSFTLALSMVSVLSVTAIMVSYLAR